MHREYVAVAGHCAWFAVLFLSPFNSGVQIAWCYIVCVNYSRELKLDLNASMTYGSNNITFSCTLKPTNKNYRTLAREWESRVRDQVMKYLSENIDCLERSVSSDIWNKFVEWTGKFILFSFLHC